MAYYQSLGLHIERVMTDNGKVFDSRLFVAVCEQHHIKRLHTRFYRPQTNGKAERFIQTAIREWAYGRSYDILAPAPPTCRAGCITTIGTARTAALAGFHPSAAFSSLGTTC